MIHRDFVVPQSPNGAGGSGPRSLAELRRQIDATDDQLLELLERRLELARGVGAAKSSEPSPYLNLKPDREAHVLSRLVARAAPETKALALSLWREVMAAGLAVQGELTVEVWPDSRTPDWLHHARDRFGAAARYQWAESPAAALAAAAARNTVALLAIDPERPWWTELAERYPELWVFEMLEEDASTALAVGRIDPGALAAGAAVRLVRDAGSEPLPSRGARALAFSGAWRLELAESSSGLAGPADRRLGLLGRAGRLQAGRD
jgi:chorismate mutase